MPLHVEFAHDVGQHQEQGRAGWGGGGWCTAFCLHCHPNVDVILEEVEVCLHPRDPALRLEEHPAQLHNSGLTGSCEASPVAPPILCPGGASKAVGDDQGSGLSSFHTGRSQCPEVTRTTITQKLGCKVRTRIHVSNASCVNAPAWGLHNWHACSVQTHFLT